VLTQDVKHTHRAAERRRVLQTVRHKVVELRRATTGAAWVSSGHTVTQNMNTPGKHCEEESEETLHAMIRRAGGQAGGTAAVLLDRTFAY
jgi:hypothetical protein